MLLSQVTWNIFDLFVFIIKVLLHFSEILFKSLTELFFLIVQAFDVVQLFDLLGLRFQLMLFLLQLNSELSQFDVSLDLFGVKLRTLCFNFLVFTFNFLQLFLEFANGLRQLINLRIYIIQTFLLFLQLVIRSLQLLLLLLFDVVFCLKHCFELIVLNFEFLYLRQGFRLFLFYDGQLFDKLVFFRPFFDELVLVVLVFLL